ncbi:MULTISPECIES: Zn-dependent hydrolase [unclassified Brenneria]|uniref:Zn-dependent hydrolase n=1 Tax=unclassified Brenneria TaxID=2634434 RepID=UPI001557A671|nr:MULTISPECIES: Zn-dependent hydrolase [unclassified Brenneria]MBJ7223952.1 Zn-dependent hydrolase [Brenneria sp. L3-3C-1]MEE3645196.1 Zn-dependent hydrolase [Brenneria sp. L3_3C_1]MEE3649921.1 Zn-dependent hydrolase [Brenneria sp. HEZEL_4_2_4]NPC99879.1 Zn-dependent hydrolase [Brenneria sp. hezel4-2-4]
MSNKVDSELFLNDLYELRKIGAYKTGVSRPTYSAADMESRRWLMRRMTDVGLEATMDGIGNVFGRTNKPGPKVLVGSHIESQIEAGWLDGALGVVAGVALARAGFAVDVCAFADEEGHFSGGYLGSRSIVGALTEEEIDQSRGRHNGPPLRSALEAAGLAGIPRLQIDPERYRGFFEMHIEQGTQLENAGLRLGVVSGIVGIWTWRIVIEGQQDHAGGTRMSERRDAGLAAVRLLSDLDRLFPTVCSEYSTWTTCNITLDPGAPSAVIPGRAEIFLEFRDISAAVLERMEQTLRSVVQESNRRDRCKATLISTTKSMPVICDSDMMSCLEAASTELAPTAWQVMPSGAGHDAKMIAKKLPVAMLFVPSIGGVSHHWTEDTADADLILGIEVLAQGVSRFLS